MKLQLVDIDADYIIETFNISDYDLDSENDVEILKGTILDIVENYIEENL